MALNISHLNKYELIGGSKMLNQIKPIEKPNLVQTLIAQIQYVPDWKKEDFLNEFPNLDNEAKYIVQVYQTCRILAELKGVLDTVWNKYEDMQYGKRVEFINKVQSIAIDMLNEIANERSE